MTRDSNTGDHRTSFETEAPHMSLDTLDRLARRELGEDEYRALAEHLAGCESCARVARTRAAASLDALHRHFEADEPLPLEHPDRARKLAPYARGRLDIVERELIASHLDECESCAAIVATQRRRRVRMRWIAIAAGLTLALIAVLLMQRPPAVTDQPSVVKKRPPTNVPPQKPREVQQIASGYGNPEWDALVREARASGQLLIPSSIAELRPPRDVVRGPDGAPEHIRPAYRVIDETRPRFSWPAREGATTYTVFVFDGESEIARSAPLRETHWTPSRDLPRGLTLTWQVEAARDETIDTIPSPPSPPARFRIISESDDADLTRARALHDDLLLGILYARAGMLEESAVALRRAAQTDATAKRLLDQIHN